jgi:hypothetical protein
MNLTQRESGRDELKEIARNLFTLEVSTILSRGMTARKMPPIPIALIDIIGRYYRFLSGIERRYSIDKQWGDTGFRQGIISDTEEVGRKTPVRGGAVEDEDGDSRQEERWKKRIAFYRPLYWESDTGLLSNPERRRNNSGSFKAISHFAKLFRNYLLWLDREKAEYRHGQRIDDPLPGVEATKIAEDLPIIERIYRNSAILGTLVAGLEQQVRELKKEVNDCKDIGDYSDEELDALNMDEVMERSEKLREAVNKAGRQEDHPWCKRRQWFTQSAKENNPEPMMLATRVPVTSSQITEIRKIWETGTEQVVMQSVIQMDGDIITRVHPDKVNATLIHQLHNEATKTAIKTWIDMAKLVTELVGKAFNTFFDLLKPKTGN